MIRCAFFKRLFCLKWGGWIEDIRLDGERPMGKLLYRFSKMVMAA